MTTSLIIKSPSASTDTTLPKVLTDSLLNTGSLFLMDFLRLGCWNPATDTVADGAAVRNLVTGGTAGMLKIPVAGDLTFETGLGFKLKDTANFGRVQVGAGTDYFQTNLSDDYLIIAWATYPATDLLTTPTGFLVTKGNSSSYALAGPFLAKRYISGSMTGKLDSAGDNGTSFAGASPAGKHQFAVAKVGTTQTLYVDGVSVYSQTNADANMIANANPLNFGNPASAGTAAGGLILHRIYGENLTISGLTPAAVVAADYAANSSRFV